MTRHLVLASAAEACVWMFLFSMGEIGVCADEEPNMPSAGEVEREILRLIGPPRERDPVHLDEVAAAVAKTFGPAAVPALKELTTRAGRKSVPRTSFFAIAMLADDLRAYEFLERWVASHRFSDSASSLIYMPQGPRDKLLWDFFTRNLDILDYEARGRASGAAYMLAQIGAMARVEAVAERSKTSSDKRIYAIAVDSLAERQRLQRLIGASDDDLVAWNTVQLSYWYGSSKLHVVDGTHSATGLPAPYCVARALLPGDRPMYTSLLSGYLSFCGKGAFWQALQDTDGVVEVIADANRPDELRRAAVRILVGAPKSIDDVKDSLRPNHPALVSVKEALEALRTLAVIGDTKVRSWIAQEILAQVEIREHYQEIMRWFSADNRLDAGLRDKCAAYAKAAK